MSAQRSHKLYRAKGRRNTQDEQKPSGRKRSERGRRGAREVGQGAPRRRRRHHSGRPQWGASYRRSFAHAPLHVSPVGYGMEGGWCLVQMWPLGVDANLHWLLHGNKSSSPIISLLQKMFKTLWSACHNTVDLKRPDLHNIPCAVCVGRKIETWGRGNERSRCCQSEQRGGRQRSH